MYIPKHFEVKDLQQQVEIIKNYPLGILFTSCPSSGGLLGFWKNGQHDRPDSELCATHVPFYFIESPEGKHKLIAHLAIQNNQVEQLENVSNCLVTFQSTDSYVSPSWYTLKPKTHKYVPTWDFAAVHVYGTPKIIRGDKEWLLNMLNLMTDQEEGKRPTGENFKEKWKISDAPDSYLNVMLKNIVGLEIEITHIESKFKFDQNKNKIDVSGLIDNFEHEIGGEKGMKLAEYIRECQPNED
ncbi:hypothetical protein BZL39_A03750 [Zygosaccharomyces parabailii]|nr:hypothetical protein BZL39_A03750 [Zygosaccharomyces parabailii]CDH12847.1 related to Similarity to B.subtilis transcriptional regulatory protein [Zygosaccharomyces bailii ISA1307]